MGLPEGKAESTGKKTSSLAAFFLHIRLTDCRSVICVVELVVCLLKALSPIRASIRGEILLPLS